MTSLITTMIMTLKMTLPKMTSRKARRLTKRKNKKQMTYLNQCSNLEKYKSRCMFHQLYAML